MNEQKRPAVAGPVEPTVRPGLPVIGCVWSGMVWLVSLRSPVKMDLGARLYTEAELDAAAARILAHAKEVHATSEHMHDRNNALRLYVSDLTAVMLRMVAGIDHLAEIARQWEPDHSSGADRRGWVLAKDARDDAWRLLQEHAQRIGPNA